MYRTGWLSWASLNHKRSSGSKLGRQRFRAYPELIHAPTPLDALETWRQVSPWRVVSYESGHTLQSRSPELTRKPRVEEQGQ